jgi:hypothetical protein
MSLSRRRLATQTGEMGHRALRVLHNAQTIVEQILSQKSTPMGATPGNQGARDEIPLSNYWSKRHFGTIFRRRQPGFAFWTRPPAIR